MKQLELNNKIVTLDEDVWFQYKHNGFRLKPSSFCYYALVFAGGVLRNKTVSRVIMNAPADLFVDHIDGNPLNNLRSNLRIATASQNQANRPTNNSTGYRGVYKSNSSYKALISVEGKDIYLGTFPSAMLAAKAYEQAAEKYFGKFAFHIKE